MCLRAASVTCLPARRVTRRQPLRLAGLAALLVAAACGGSPSSPTPTTPPTSSQPSRVTVVASITNTVSGATAGSVTSEVASLPATLEFSLPGFVTRSTSITSSRPTVDLIPDAPPFSLDFYRQLVRGSADERSLQPLRRWTRAPLVYIRTIDESGTAVPTSLLDATEKTIVETVQMFTGGRFGAAGVERGTSSRELQPGWLTVKWPTDNRENICGRATIGLEGGYIEFYYTRLGSCACGALPTRPRTVRHELGHAMGFWHTSSTADIMSATAVGGCDALPSERERVHASIAYARLPGNRDVDVDPADTPSTRGLRDQPRVVIRD